MYGIQAFSEKISKMEFENIMGFMNGFIGHITFESATDETGYGIEAKSGLKALLEIVSGLKNEKCVNSIQTAARRNKDRARVESLRNVPLGNFTFSKKKLIKSHKVVVLESNSAKKLPPNNSPAERYRILGSSAERLKQ